MRVRRSALTSRAAQTAVLSRVTTAILTALIPTAPLFALAGWPVNQELLRLFRRIGIFAGQWRLGHLIPVWSTTAFHGAGSPSPILYHKAFNWLSTLLTVLTGSPKFSVCASLALLLATLFLGIAKSCRVLLGRHDLIIEATAGMLAVFATYTTTDWLIRGAMGEVAAMAVLAWVFAWCLILIQRGHFSRWIGPLMATMYFAHPAIALYCAIPLACALATAALRWRGRLAAWIGPVLASVGLCIALTGPWVVASVPFTAFASLGLLANTPFSSAVVSVPFGQLFYGPPWHWSGLHAAPVFQIDWLLLAMGVLLLPVCAFNKQGRAAGAFLAVVCITMLLLQTQCASALYQHVPGMAWLQFSYRLLVFVTICLALSGALVLDRVLAGCQKWPGRGLCAACAVLMSLGKPWAGAGPVRFYNTRDIDTALTNEINAPEAPEYVAAPLGLIGYHGSRAGEAVGCFASPLDDMGQERATARFAVSCTIKGGARLAIALAPGMRFSVQGRRVAAFRACPEAFARLAVPVNAVVTVTFPTFWSAIGAAFRAHDPARACHPSDD